MNGKTFQINLERNDYQSGLILCGDKCLRMNFPSPPSFFMKKQCIVGSPEGKHFKNVLKFITFHYSNCETCFFHSVKTMRNNSETSTDRNKSAQYKIKSRHYKWLLLIAENVFKKSYQFHKVRTCVFAKRTLRP